MLPEEISAIKQNATSQNISQPQVSYSNQYGYEIVEGNSSSSLHYSSGGSNASSGCHTRSGGDELVRGDGPMSDENQRMNVSSPTDIAVLAMHTPVLSEGSPSISGDENGQNHGSGTPNRRRDRISEYEACCKNTTVKGWKGKSKGNDLGLALGGGAEVVRFQVKKTVWGDRVGSPISRFPNEVLTHTFSFLDPASLSALSLVSKRFHTLISSPHAWRSAFARYFPEQAHLHGQQKVSRLPSPSLNPTPLRSHDEETRASYSSDKRYFTCLTSDSSWRKEYLLRTSLLRSLSRGKAHVPQYTPPKHPESRNLTSAGSIITYPGCTGGHSVTHISATFPPIDRGPKNTVNGNGNINAQGQGSAASRPHVIHASCETGVVASSDPTTGRIDRQPLVDGASPFQRPSLDWPIPGFSEHRPGIQLGSSLVDLSDELGWCWGETVPGGRVYVEPKFLSTTPFKGVFLPHPAQIHPLEVDAYVSSLWIAKKKSKGIFEMTNSKCGLLVGRSMGRLTMYCLPNTVKERDNPRLWTANHISWLVCPGVPIVDIKVDEDYSTKRMRKHRRRKEGMVIVIINALGEVWYLRDLSGPWRLLEQTRRTVRYMDDDDRKDAETPEKNLALHWEKVRSFWNGWGLDYFLEVDFAGGNVIVGKKGKKYIDPVTGELDRVDESEDKEGGWVKCFTLGTKTNMDMEGFLGGIIMDKVYPSSTTEYTKPQDGQRSIFGSNREPETTNNTNNTWEENPLESEEFNDDIPGTPTERISDEDLWTEKVFSFSEEKLAQKSIVITAVATDKSSLAVVAPDEDDHFRNNTNDVPGLNARLFAVGTATGTVFIWNLRSPVSDGIEQPLRIIHTESPMITTLGLTSLYLIHGGSDGLVQCWDPLASTLEPIRTIHSRFSSRARRRMAQAEQNNQNLAIADNQYAARAVQLDPDPTVLRGVIALGTYVRYWSFAGDISSAINGKRKKKLARRGGVGGGLPSPPGRGRIVQGWKGEINGELADLEQEKEKKKREEERLRQKFGVPGFGFGELSEEEMVLYARMLSEEAFEKEKEKDTNGLGFVEGNSSNFKGGFSGEPIATSDEDEEAALAAAITASALEAEELARAASASGSQFTPSASSSASVFDGDSTQQGDEIDADLAEAIRLSLLDSTPGAGVSFRYSYADEGDDYDYSTPGGSSSGDSGGGSSISTAVLLHSSEEYGFGTSNAPPSSTTETRIKHHPISLSTPKPPSLTTTNKLSQKQKKMMNYREKDEWPSPRQAASMANQTDDGVLGGVDDDLEFAIRLSLAEEESRRMTVGSGGEAAKEENEDNRKGKGKAKRNMKGKGKGKEKV